MNIDPERAAALDATVREALENEMREDGADAETIAAALANVRGTVVWARGRETRKPGEKTTKVTHGAEPTTSEGLVRARRRLPGGANRGGRTDERSARLADYATAIRTLSEQRYRPAAITVREVAKRLSRVGGESLIRKDVSPDGWRQFRSEVLSGRFSGR